MADVAEVGLGCCFKAFSRGVAVGMASVDPDLSDGAEEASEPWLVAKLFKLPSDPTSWKVDNSPSIWSISCRRTEESSGVAMVQSPSLCRCVCVCCE